MVLAEGGVHLGPSETLLQQDPVHGHGIPHGRPGTSARSLRLTRLTRVMVIRSLCYALISSGPSGSLRPRVLTAEVTRSPPPSGQERRCGIIRSHFCC